MLQPREIMWRRVMDDLSFEHATIRSGPSGPELAGTVFVAVDEAPLRLDYLIICDEDWCTRNVNMTQNYRGARQSHRLDHDGQGSWLINGDAAPQLAGCTDVDLGLSPSTNALPINRLGLRTAATSTIRAAWVRFPSLQVHAAEQSYARLGDRHYRYRSLASGFEAMLHVDSDGLPIEYEGVWRRVGEGSAAPAPRQAASSKR